MGTHNALVLGKPSGLLCVDQDRIRESATRARRPLRPSGDGTRSAARIGSGVDLSDRRDGSVPARASPIDRGKETTQ